MITNLDAYLFFGFRLRISTQQISKMTSTTVDIITAMITTMCEMCPLDSADDKKVI